MRQGIEYSRAMPLPRHTLTVTPACWIQNETHNHYPHHLAFVCPQAVHRAAPGLWPGQFSPRFHRRSHGGHHRPTTGHGVGRRRRHHPGQGLDHRRDRGLPDLRPRRQPLFDRRADGCLHGRGAQRHRQVRLRRPAGSDPAGGCCAAGHLDQVHPRTRGHRLHVGYRGDHLFQPGKEVSRTRCRPSLSSSGARIGSISAV